MTLLSDWSLAWIISLLLLWILLTTIGSFNIRSNYFIKAYHQNKSISAGKISLSFDDGPHPDFTPMVLALLRKYNMKATFFCIGENIKLYPDIFQRIIDEGHVVGNHTYRHDKWFGFFSSSEVIKELTKNQELVANMTGLMMNFFRPPFGVTNPYIARAAAHLNLYVLGWSVRSLDTLIKNPKRVYRRIIKRLTPGDVVLMHDTSKNSVKALELLLHYLKQQDYRSVGLDELLKIKAYA